MIGWLTKRLLWVRFKAWLAEKIPGWIKNQWHAQGNWADLVDTHERLSMLLSHTTGLAKSNYTKQAMELAFDEARETDLREHSRMMLNDMGLISDREYADLIHGMPSPKKSDTDNALITLRAVRDSIRKANHKRNAELLDGIIEQLEEGVRIYG